MDKPIADFDRLRQLCILAQHGTLSAGERGGDAAGEGPDLAFAERHRVVPLMQAGLSGLDRISMPVHRRVLALALQTVRLEQELGILAECLTAAGVEFLLLKGPAIARQAYPFPEWRVYDDLDLWVESRDLEAADRALTGAGYHPFIALSSRAASCARRAGIESAWVHPERGRLIEISHGHRALAPSAAAARLVLQSAVQMDVAGTRVRTTTPVHTLLLACIHGAHHRWDRLSWVADIAGLWKKLSSDDQIEACAVAHRWRVETSLGLGLRLAADYLDLPLDSAALDLSSLPRIQALAARVNLEEIHADSLRVPMLERLRFENDAQDTARQRLRMKWNWLCVPTLGDIEAVPLPGPLFFLYAWIRPLRLLRHPWLREWRTLLARRSP
jgi:Uncharacterised nucleotidyltransferase